MSYARDKSRKKIKNYPSRFIKVNGKWKFKAVENSETNKTNKE